ncbi:UNVERIFIED_ORG: hypothetical protein LHJ69_23595 [Shinella sp. XGS7]|nr:hypothetical protein [Shinella sp. XGS7]
MSVLHDKCLEFLVEKIIECRFGGIKSAQYGLDLNERLRAAGWVEQSSGGMEFVAIGGRRLAHLRKLDVELGIIYQEKRQELVIVLGGFERSR